MGNFPPHEAFVIGGTNSVRGYEEGAVASGRSYVIGSGELSFPLVSPHIQICQQMIDHIFVDLQNTTPNPVFFCSLDP